MATAENMENQDSEMNFETALEQYLKPEMGDFEEGSIVKGETNYRENPTLSNPTDWRLIVSLITAFAAIASLIVSILALIACNKMLC